METNKRKRLAEAVRTITKTQAQAQRHTRIQKAAASPGDRRRILREYQKALSILESFFSQPE